MSCFPWLYGREGQCVRAESKHQDVVRGSVAPEIFGELSRLRAK